MRSSAGTAANNRVMHGLAGGLVPFALLLIGGCNRTHSKDVVATVNGHSIMSADMDRMYQAQLGQQAQQTPGQQPSPEEAD